MTRVAVIGAGIVGLSAALHLRLAGAETMLLDRAVPGRETSVWNAGVLATSSIQSLANPGIFRKLPAILSHRTPGARIDWRAAREVLPWGLRFLLASRAGPSLRASATLHALISRSRLRHEALLAQAGAGDLLRREGWLVLHRSPEALAAAGRSVGFYDRFGVRHQTVDAARLREMEPALRPRFAGAILFPESAAAVDPRPVLAAYAALYRQAGGEAAEQWATGLLHSAEGWRVATKSGPVGPFDHVVLACGAWTNRLLSPFARLPLVVERGYLRRYALDGRRLRRPVYDVAGGFVLSPRPEGVQLSTGAEFTRLDASPGSAMFAEAEREARAALDLGAAVDEAPAVGNRPSLPDGLPAIGAAPGPRGLWVAAGHQHIGFSTGPASGELLCDLLLGRPPAMDPAPFAPRRFRL